MFEHFFKRNTVSPPHAYAEDLMASLLVMAWIVEARDPYTGGHLWRVSRYARMLAQNLQLAEEEVARVALGGFLHDLGKIAIPDAILNKRDRLTAEEYDIIKTHPAAGMRMLAGHPLGALVKNVVLFHHEMPNGQGYPNGVAGDHIPRDARIVGICDAFDAMTSTRPYRKGMPIQQALGIIEENLGRQFDRTIGRDFLQLGHAGMLDHIAGHTDEGIPLHECPMCGPTLVLRKNQVAGSLVYCRNCAGEFIAEHTESGLVPRATGKKGNAKNLEVEADTELIQRLIRESAKAVTHSAVA